MSDSPSHPSTSVDSSSIFEGVLTAVGISVVLIVFDGIVLAGGLLQWTSHFWLIFLLLSPLLIFAFVCKAILLARHGWQRAFNGNVGHGETLNRLLYGCH